MSELEIIWHTYRPSHGPHSMRAFVGPHKVGFVQRAMSGNGYTTTVALPGAKPVPSMFTEAEAMQEAEKCIRAWFEAIPGLEVL